MPLPMKTLKEAAADLGIPEGELKAMVQANKVRAVMRKGALCIAPDEIAKIRRVRKTVLDPAYHSAASKPATPAKPAAAGPAAKTGAAAKAPPPRTTTSSSTTRAPIPKPAGLKLPEPPPKDA